MHGYVVPFIIHLSTLWVHLGGWTTDLSKKRPIQFSVALPQPAYILNQVIYRERKKLAFDIGTKTHLIEFSTFSRLPPTRFSYIESFKHVWHWLQAYNFFLLLDFVTKSAVFTSPWMTCQSVITFQRRKFQKHDYKIDQSIKVSQSTNFWVGEIGNNELHCAWLISIHTRGLQSDETAHCVVSNISHLLLWTSIPLLHCTRLKYYWNTAR